MPQYDFQEQLFKNISEEAKEINWETSVQNIKRKKVLIAWGQLSNDKYVLFEYYPISMNQAFGMTGRKHPQLSYCGKKINPWLIGLYSTFSFMKFKNFNPTFVLLDTRNKNDNKSKIIGVKLPDTSNLIPIPIIPGKISDKSKVLHNTIKTAGSFSQELTEKQLNILKALKN